jgi:hypothetical protein
MYNVKRSKLIKIMIKIEILQSSIATDIKKSDKLLVRTLQIHVIKI